jgi:hypothetical protein
MKFFALVITEDTLPLVTELNEGIEPAPESMNHVFLYPATKPDENYSTILTPEEFASAVVIDKAFSISIVEMR